MKNGRQRDSHEGRELLTSVEVADLLRVHPKHIYRLLARGLPARRIGAGWRFVRAEVLAWSSAQAGGKAPPLAAPSEPPISVPQRRPPLLAANGDVGVELLLAALNTSSDAVLGFVQADGGGGLQLLANRSVLAAGFHGKTPPAHLGAARLARVHLVTREVGLAHPREMRIGNVKALKGKRLATRPSTAGVRVHLDRALSEEGTSLQALHVAATEHESHREAVFSLLRGQADVALTTSAWAQRVGLGFTAIATEPYDLLLYAEDLGATESVRLCELLQAAALRKTLRGIAGYDVKRSGDIRYEFARG